MSSFKSAKRGKSRPIRKRRHSGSSSGDEGVGGSSGGDEEDTSLAAVLADVKDLQKMRARPAGMSVTELAVGKDEKKVKSSKNSDPLHLQQGGMVDLKTLSSRDLKDVDLEDTIRQQFSKESHLRDEDEEMRKFVEGELQRRKGGDEAESLTGKIEPTTSATGNKPVVYQNPEDKLFADAAERMKRYSSSKKEDMLSNQMLCGIPEVDLGIDAKIRNIEDTESAKLKLLKDATSKEKNLQHATQFRQDVVKNTSCEYVMHRKYNIDESTALGHETSQKKKPMADGRPRRPTTQPIPVVGDDTPRWMLPDQGKIVSKSELPPPEPPRKSRAETEKLTKEKLQFIGERREFATGHGAQLDFDHVTVPPNDTPDHDLEQIPNYPTFN